MRQFELAFYRDTRVARSQKIKKAKFGHNQFQKRPNSQMVKKAKFWRKFTKNIFKNFEVCFFLLYVLLKFCQNWPKKILFSSRLKKGQEKAKWPNHFISRKLFQKRPNGNPARYTTLSIFITTMQCISAAVILFLNCSNIWNFDILGSNQYFDVVV